MVNRKFEYNNALCVRVCAMLYVYCMFICIVLSTIPIYSGVCVWKNGVHTDKKRPSQMFCGYCCCFCHWYTSKHTHWDTRRRHTQKREWDRDGKSWRNVNNAGARTISFICRPQYSTFCRLLYVQNTWLQIISTCFRKELHQSLTFNK